MAVDRDLARLDIEESGEHIQYGSLSGTSGSDKGYLASGGSMQGDSFQDRFLRLVTEVNVFHGYIALYIL